ncbi:hypothetical protein AVV36_gp013 [Pectobacterium bacteriophage PM2]|uniref:Uncharacterized protein n=1 Tax=Pectobacterium bacteriophage PM2 TaxID=1429794 RepID=A0A0A0Q2C1_9CAUD|nr:hypothetical protein AVV36_gp013 [Pectobacterium bacteriophage PM2]AHY24975.1 hypothetical protein PM2_013 [Pectobacterium bacteriophage PM2]
MLKINEYAANQLIAAYRNMVTAETSDPGSQYPHHLQILFEVSSLCEYALNTAAALGQIPEIYIPKNMLADLSYLADLGKL